MSRLSEWIPLVGILKRYDKPSLKGDLSAGLTVGVMLVPQGMAYALLAGMPPVYGLFSATVPLVIYGILGSSSQLAVGPVAMVSLLIASGVGQWAEPGTPLYISLALQLAMLTGIIQCTAGLLRFGFFANFLSRPVIHGFTTAAALIIAGSQLGHLLGIPIPRSIFLHRTLFAIWQYSTNINLETLGIGVFGIAVIWGARRIHRSLPGALIAVVLASAFVYVTGLANRGVIIIGDVAQGLPPLVYPNLSLDTIGKLFPTALSISLVGFLQSFSIAKRMASKHPNQRVNANREFFALGAANGIGSFGGAFPVGGGFARTAVNDQAGAKSGMASILSAATVLSTLLFFTPLFYYLPNAILAAIILVAVVNLFDLKEAVSLWRTDRRDFFTFGITFFTTLALGIELGIGIAVILSLLLVVWRAANPHSAVLGKLPSTRHYMNIERFNEAQVYPGVLIFRFDAPLFFGNIRAFEDRIASLEREQTIPLRLFVLDAGAIHCIDSSAMHVLKEIVSNFKARKIEFCAASVRGPVRDTMARSGLVNVMGDTHLFLNVADAVDWFNTKNKKEGASCLSNN